MARPSIDMSPEEFREIGHQLVDDLAEFLGHLSQMHVTPGEKPDQVLATLGDGPLPASGVPAREALSQATKFLIEHSLFNGHPRFMGYITSSPAPLGALGDLLASLINPNVGAWILSPAASEIEQQTIRWIAEMIGCSTGSGGILVSGGNMANFVGFLAARTAKANWDIRQQGLRDGSPLCIYAAKQTHTWIQKAMDLFGLGTENLRWIATDADYRMDVEDLQRSIRQDKNAGFVPCMVIGTAGTVTTGRVDPLRRIAEVCEDHDVWFHVDGAYGAFAAILEEAPADLHHLDLADSIALDPHKWLYAPIEAGCTLVRDRSMLTNAFSYRPSYYKFEHGTSFNEYGLQNTRGFRALKIWLGLKQMGLEGYRKRIRRDVELAKHLFALAKRHSELEAWTTELSITTFRYRPQDMPEEQANEINQEILTRIQEGGEAFVSNAVLDEAYLLRACVVNFRTSEKDMEALVDLVVRLGRELRPR